MCDLGNVVAQAPGCDVVDAYGCDDFAPAGVGRDAVGVF